MRPALIADAVAAKVEKVRARRRPRRPDLRRLRRLRDGGAARRVSRARGPRPDRGRPLLRVLRRRGRLRGPPGGGARDVLPDRLPGPPVRLDHRRGPRPRPPSRAAADYFGNYRRLVYLAQTDDPELTARARRPPPIGSGLAFERRLDRLRRPRPVHPARRRRSRLTMAPCCRSSGGATSPPRSSPRTPAGRARSSSTRASRSPSTRRANRAGMREYNAYIGEWRKTHRAVRRRPRGRGQRRGRTARGRIHEAPPRGADPDRRRRRRTGPAARHDIGDLRDMTDTVLSSARARSSSASTARSSSSASGSTRPAASSWPRR